MLSPVAAGVPGARVRRRLTHREVAELLDVPLGAVKARIRDGQLRLAGVVDCSG